MKYARADIDEGRNCHPLVTNLLRRINAMEMTIKHVEREAGLTPGTIYSWRTLCSPSLVNIEAALNAVGLELCIREKRQ